MNMAKKNIGSARRRVGLRRGKNDAVVARRVIIGVICAAIVVVMIGLIGSFFWNNQRRVETKMEEMAREYYEGFIYENLVHGAMSKEEVEKVVSRYKDRGFAAVNLRQLLLYDGKRNMESAGFIKEYCDENRTSVKFYPEEPYDKKSYRIEYTYKCGW